MSEPMHDAVYDPREPHIGAPEDCHACNARTLAHPKPPKRIKDPELLARFAEVRPRCQACGSGSRPQIHHMGDAPGVHRKSDVFENLARLCRLEDVHTMVVDNQISEDWRSKLIAAGVKLLLAGETDNA